MMRRIIRAAYLGEEPDGTLSLVNETAVVEIQQAK